MSEAGGISRTEERARTPSATTVASRKQEEHFLNTMCSCKLSLSQVMFTVVEEVEEELPRSSAALSFSSLTVGMQSRVKNMAGQSEEYVVPDSVTISLSVRCITLSSGIGTR